MSKALVVNKLHNLNKLRGEGAMIEKPAKWTMRQMYRLAKLSIPEYQRGYAWGTDEVEDFINDLNVLWEHSGKDVPEHFMGTVLSIVGKDPYYGDVTEVIDGQQRLTTTSMLIASIRFGAQSIAGHEHSSKNVKAKANALVEECNKSLLRGSGSSVYPLLSLNERDNEHWVRIARDGMVLSAHAHNDAIASVQRLDSAFKMLRAEVVEKITATIGGPKDAARVLDELERRLNVALDGLVIVGLSASRPDDVYDMFMVVNDRGKPLSALDLIRTNVLRKLKGDEPKFRNAKAKFSHLLEVEESDARRALTHYENSRTGERCPKSMLLKSINAWLNAGAKNPGYTAELMKRSIQLCAGTDFLLEFEAKKPAWHGRAYPFPGERAGAERQHRIIGALKHEACKPLLVAGMECLGSKGYHDMLGVIERIAMRYLLTNGLHPSELADFYISNAGLMRRPDSGWSPESMWRHALAAKGLEKRKVLNLAKQCPDDRMHEGVLELRYNGGRNLMAHILLGIDAYDWASQQPASEVVFDWQAIHLDHICPKTHAESEIVQQDFANVIGNLAPIADKKNLKMSNMPYGKEKARFYRQSKVPMTVDIGEDYEKWTLADVRRRSEDVAKKAVKVWSLAEQIWDL